MVLLSDIAWLLPRSRVAVQQAFEQVRAGESIDAATEALPLLLGVSHRLVNGCAMRWCIQRRLRNNAALPGDAVVDIPTGVAVRTSAASANTDGTRWWLVHDDGTVRLLDSATQATVAESSLAQRRGFDNALQEAETGIHQHLYGDTATVAKNSANRIEAAPLVIPQGVVVVGHKSVGRLQGSDGTDIEVGSTLRWSWRRGAVWAESAPAYDRTNDAIVYGDEDGSVVARAVTDGTLLWRADVGAPVEAAPVLVGAQWWVPTQGKRIALLNDTGRTQGVLPTIDDTFEVGVSHTTARTADGFPVGHWVVSASADGNTTLWLQQQQDGTTNVKPLWSKRVGPPIDARPAIDRNGVYVASNDGCVWRLRMDDGRQAFRTCLHARIESPLTLDSGLVYAVTQHGQLAAIDADDGTLLWSHYNAAGYDESGAVVRNNMLVLAGLDGMVHAFRADQLLRNARQQIQSR